MQAKSKKMLYRRDFVKLSWQKSALLAANFILVLRI